MKLEESPPAARILSPDTDPRRPVATYWLTRFVLLRLLGFVYAVAFLVAANQIVPLIGEDGLLPVGAYLDQIVRRETHTAFMGFVNVPSVFWVAHSDFALQTVAWLGFALSCVVVAGYANALMMIVLWLLYMSFVNVGQDWYGFGWEIQLLETGFLAIFLCPLLEARPFPRRPPPLAIIVMFRWLVFRIMLGAGLIKIRGDPAWKDFTALYYHFETQPIPNGLSRWFHFLPRLVLRFGVVGNHIAELVAPWFVFWPRLGRHIAGSIIILFQVVLICSGNLSFLNWLTIVPALACFDDSVWAKILPRALTRRAERADAFAVPSKPMVVTSWVVAALLALLSIPVVQNLASPHQAMNTSFDTLHLLNTYGAFGTVGRERLNVVFEGTDAAVPDASALWKPYPYKGLPVDVFKAPPQIAPYQLHLDWQMWFAAMGSVQQYPWTIHLVWKLLHNDPVALSLFASNPFPDKPPHYIRAVLYLYQFAEPGNSEGRYWNRQVVSAPQAQNGWWLPPLSIDNEALRNDLQKLGWLDSFDAPDVPESK